MRISNVAACMILSSQMAYAMEWSEIKDTVINTDWTALLEGAQATHAQVRDAYNTWEPQTRVETNRKLAHPDRRRAKPLTEKHIREARRATHDTKARRDLLGLPRITGSPQVRQEFQALNSFSGLLLNTIAGMSYNNEPGVCFDAVERSIEAFDATTDILKKIYNPAYIAML